ncbi:unnamed protein product, partial [Polarella glacialis]
MSHSGDILKVARRSPYYQNRFFDIIDFNGLSDLLYADDTLLLAIKRPAMEVYLAVVAQSGAEYGLSLHLGSSSIKSGLNASLGCLQVALKQLGSYAAVAIRSSRRDLLMTYKGQKSKGIFFQWDGESRFAFSPTGESFHIHIRKVLNIPVVIGPFVNERLTGPLDNGEEVKFSFWGETPEILEQVRRRVLRFTSGELDHELN